MSKELIERAQNIARQLTYNDDTLQAQAKHTLLECAVRIEELEREVRSTAGFGGNDTKKGQQ